MGDSSNDPNTPNVPGAPGRADLPNDEERDDSQDPNQ